MRKRTMVVGGGIIGLAAVTGMWLSGLFQGIGSGGGGGSSGGVEGESSEGETVQVSVPDDVRVGAAPQQAAGAGPGDGADLPGPVELISVVIEGDQYTVWTRPGGRDLFRPVEVPELIALARETTGTDEGIRVRIFRRESARVSMTDRLAEALRDAGFEEKEYEIQPTLLEDRDAS